MPAPRGPAPQTEGETDIIGHADLAPTRAPITEAHAGLHRCGDPHARPWNRLDRGDVRHRVWRAARAAAVRPAGSTRQRRPADARAPAHPAATRRLLHL